MTAPQIDNAPPTGGDKFTNAEHLGELVVITVRDVGHDVFDGNEADFIIGDVLVVDGPPEHKGEQYLDAWLFGRVLYGQLKRKIGRTVVGRITLGEKKGSKSAPWQLEPATDAELAKAQAALAASMRPDPAPAGGGEAPEARELDEDTPPWERGK